MDANVGDLVVCISKAGLCGNCYCDNDPRVVEGGVYTVSFVSPPAFEGDSPGYELAEAPIGNGDDWCACAFRKIDHDKQESCDADFAECVKRSPVSA